MINLKTVTEVWILKRKKVNQHLGCFGDQRSAARVICNRYGFIDTVLYVSFSTFIHHKETFKDLVSHLQFSVYIELSHMIVFSKTDGIC